MKIIKHLPWWFRFIKKKFPAIDEARVILAFGDRAYSNAVVMEDKAAHEMVHHKQQRHSKLYAIWWWVKYMRNPHFRLAQELEAYRAEWRWIQANNPDKHQNFRYLDAMARDLSSGFYGKIIFYYDAKTLIENN